MPENFTHEQYISPFTWRYGTPMMRTLWGEINKRRLWRRVWVALARAQHSAGLVTAEQVADLEANSNAVNMERAHAIEAEIHHDLMAEVHAFAEQCPVGGSIIHLGATSADIEDNTDVLRMRDSLNLIASHLRGLLLNFADKIDELADLPTMAFTHIQPAEPTTMGYRLAVYAQDLLGDYQDVQIVLAQLRGKGLKGAVGTGAAYIELLSESTMTVAELEQAVMSALDLPYYPIATQTYPRKQDWRVMSALAGLAASLHKFALDLRFLQSPVLGEWGEPFSNKQVGSSAMPFKRNPINAEKINSLSRLVAAQAQIAWENASQAVLERSLDDSANRREMLPVAFLATDELVRVTRRVVSGLRIDEHAARHTLDRFGTFAAVERVLMAAVKAGGDRQALHEHLREHSLAAWAVLSANQPNPLVERLTHSDYLQQYLSSDQIRVLLDASAYVGAAPERAREFAQQLRQELAHPTSERT